MSEVRLLACAMLLSGGMAAAVAAATLRYGPDLDPGYGVEPPLRIAGVRLAEITAAYTTRAATEGRTSEEVRAWGAALEAALDHVAARHGAVLLPARAVAAGAPDLTRQVEAALARFLARRTGGSAGSAPGDGR
ncbi:MAG: TrbI F-type domain-containing protein [Defluviicoccus sp.]|nr:TrbI F-type domain-containing protein [Defluviicoccus sp.]